MIYREMSQSSQLTQGDKVIFDTDKPPAGLENLADISQTFVGAKLSYLLSPQGRVSDLKGVEEIARRLNKAVEGAAPAMATAMKAQTEAMLSPESIIMGLGSAYKALPAQSATPGQTWKYSDVSPMMGTTFSTAGQSTFVGRENGRVMLSQTANFSTDGGAEFKVPMPAPDPKERDPKAPAPRLQLDLSGTSTGQSWIDENTGLEVKSHSKQELKGEVIISGLAGRGTTMTIPMTSQIEVSSQTELLAPAA